MKNAKQQLIQLVLYKGVEKYIFRYEDGQEDKLLDALIAQAEDNRTSIDWLDAAVLSTTLAPSLMSQINELHNATDFF